MLAIRSALSFGLLIALAAAFQLLGRQSPVADSSAWWLWFVTLANLACIFLMVHFGRLEGLRLRDIYFASRSTWKGDLVWTLIAIIGIALLAQPPGIAGPCPVGKIPTIQRHVISPLPPVAVYPLIFSCQSPRLAEPPTYFGYVSPFSEHSA
jgi:hypothetical protein